MKAILLGCWYLFSINLYAQPDTTAAEPDYSTTPHFYLMRGLSRESGHWNGDFSDRLLEQFPGAEITYMDLPGVGQFYDLPAKVSVKRTAQFLHNYYGADIAVEKGQKILLATSLGGVMALEWLRLQPDAFDGVITVNTGLKKVCKGKERARPRAKLKMIGVVLSFAKPTREEKILAINSNYFDGDSTILRRWMDIQRERPLGNFTMVKQTLANEFHKPTAEPLDVPTLVVGSQADEIVAEACTCKVAEALGADLRLHPTSGHGMPIDEPVWLAEQVSLWWKKHHPEYAPVLLPTRPGNQAAHELEDK